MAIQKYDKHIKFDRDEIISRKDAMVRGLKYYYTGNRCSKGHYSIRYCATAACVQCRLTDRSHCENKISINDKKFYGDECKNCKTNIRYKCNNNCVSCSNNSESNRLWAKNNKERRAENKKKWSERNRDRIKSHVSYRMKHVRKATPHWLSEKDHEQMYNFYKNRPDGYDVDHIIPLLSKVVCGLNVPWNLQYLTKKENLSKTNKLLPEFANCTARVSHE